MRWVIAALVVVGLAVGVVLAWPSGTEEPPDTFAATTTTTPTSLPADTTTSAAGATTTTVDEGSHVVETVAEAEEILRELWFGWFEGIYNEDEDRIREVVVLEETVETAQQSFGTMEFTQPPARELVGLEGTEVLRSDPTCLAVWSELDVRLFRPDTGENEGVHVLRRIGDEWRLLSVWTHRDDLWEADCESQL